MSVEAPVTNHKSRGMDVHFGVDKFVRTWILVHQLSVSFNRQPNTNYAFTVDISFIVVNEATFIVPLLSYYYY